MNTQRLVDLWRELRDRRIIQIFTAYLAGGWIALEVIGALVERAILPELAFRLGLVVFVAGIPASLIIGWYHGEKGDQKASVLELALLTLVVLGGITAGAAVIRASQTEEQFAEVSTLDTRRLAVLYFDDEGDARDSLAYVADGFTEALIDQLQRVPTLDVVSERGVRQFRGAGLAPDSIGRALEAGTLIDGSVEHLGKDMRVSVSLIDGGSGARFKRESFEWPRERLLEAREELATQVSRLLREWLGEEVRLRERRASTKSVGAWVLVQQAERAVRQAEELVEGGEVEDAVRRYGTADSLLALAEPMDTAWAEPSVLRAELAYEHSWLVHDRHEALEWLDRSLAHARRVLAGQPNHARTLEVRGTARYRRWLLNAESDPEKADALLNAAQEDLEAAVRLDPTLASAYSVLSHLYYQPGDHQDVTSAVLAARRAYEQDAYLRAADGVLWRLYLGSYDLENHAQAKRWCEEGHRRFPDHSRFVECQLWLMTMEAAEPEISKAWQLLEEMERLLPEPRKEYRMREARMVVGGVIARAGLEAGDSELLDSARNVLVQARAGPELDPERELLSVEAMVRVILGEEDSAVALLKRYAAANPGHFADGGPLSWWWRELRDHPEFQRLRSAGH